MKADKLINMVDFVIAESKKKEDINCCEFSSKIIEYAEFLSKPLELGMFIPCDLEGTPLEEPVPISVQKGFDYVESEYNLEEISEYKEAYKRVLFKHNFIIKSKTIFIHQDYLLGGEYPTIDYVKMKVEDLVKYDLTLRK